MNEGINNIQIYYSQLGKSYRLSQAQPEVIQSPEASIQSSIEELTKELENEKVEVQKEAIWKLNRFVKPDIPPEIQAQMVGPLLRLLENKSLNIQYSAAIVLKNLAGSSISPDEKSKMVDSFLRFLEDKNRGMRFCAIEILEKLTAEQDLPVETKTKMLDPILKAMGNEKEDNYVRHKACKSLKNLVESNIPPEVKTQTIEPLLKVFGDKNIPKILSAQALKSLVILNINPEIGPKIIKLFIETWENGGLNVQEVTNLFQDFIRSKISSQLNTLIAELLVKELGEEKKNRTTNENASVILKNLFKAPELKDSIIKFLIKALENKELGYGMPDILKDLIELSPSPKQRDKIIGSLFKSMGNYHKDDLSPAAWILIGSADSSILEVKNQVIESFIKALGDKNENIRKQVVFLLGQLLQYRFSFSSEQKIEMVDPLINILRTSGTDVCGKALKILKSFGVPLESKTKMLDPIVNDLIKNLGSSDPAVREDSARLLLYLATLNISLELKIKMVDPLLKALKEDKWRNWEGARLANEALDHIAESKDIPVEIKAKIKGRK